MNSIQTQTLMLEGLGSQTLADIFAAARTQLAAEKKTPLRMVVQKQVGEQTQLLVSYLYE